MLWEIKPSDEASTTTEPQPHHNSKERRVGGIPDLHNCMEERGESSCLLAYMLIVNEFIHKVLVGLYMGVDTMETAKRIGQEQLWWRSQEAQFWDCGKVLRTKFASCFIETCISVHICLLLGSLNVHLDIITLKPN